jgi:glycosyltransferase involved in cell wall biosynthesis
VNNFVSTIHKYYLLQDYEPYFYPPGTDYYLAEKTYSFGFTTFTGGNWIANLLKSRHNVNASVFPFGCDTTLYTPAQEIDGAKDGEKRLLFYARPSTPRRGFELAMLAFERLLTKLDNVEIILAGCDLSDYALPERIKSVGIVPMSELPALYRSCDAALIISFTNVSLLPLDLMASGCAVVSNSGPQVDWLLNNDNSMLAEADPDSLAYALERILRDDKLRQQQVVRAYKYVADKDWYKAAQMIAISLRSMQSVQASDIQAEKIGVK